ncbi:MAG: LysM peptidoglycan-binding domain-containing protein [Candidatus Aminicenantes bacterium]|nr:LysM peptidoglycan-binding domain-containing protein [Candidatus Aminicenantes bacterium]
MKRIKSILVIDIWIIILLFHLNCTTQPKPTLKPSTKSPSNSSIQKSEEKSEAEKPTVVHNQEKKKGQVDSEEPYKDEELIQEKENSAEILEEASDAYQDAQIAWEKADIDTALAALDEAYSIILKLELTPESPHFQEKNDLRLLIAQRIQEIYASHLIAVGVNHKAIPLTENKYVMKEIERFQTKERQYFLDAYKRSGLYREMILKHLKKEGLPKELSWIPVIESGFKVRAYSRARALGLWQFISSTGYRFGLKKNRWIDERMDPEKSTQAAIKYLNELHSIFGDWTTALASYNCGEFRVQRVIRAQRINYLDNFWDLFVMLPRETARFVPRFIATLLIIKNPEQYGFTLPTPDPPLRYETLTVNRPLRLSSLSKLLNLGQKSLATLNPELRHRSTPDAEYQLKIPVGLGEQAAHAIQSLKRWVPPEATYIIHYVRRGETVSGIARRYRTSVSAIARLNSLRRSFLIRPRQRLKIPSYRGGRKRQTSRILKLDKEKEKLVYKVKRGDSLQQIARAFNTTIQKIKELNNLTSNVLRVGQKLRIQSVKFKGVMAYTVRKGDTPYSIAKEFKMNLSTLLRINGLRSRSKIYPGQKLWVIPARPSE